MRDREHKESTETPSPRWGFLGGRGFRMKIKDTLGGFLGY